MGRDNKNSMPRDRMLRSAVQRRAAPFPSGTFQTVLDVRRDASRNKIEIPK